MISIRQETNKDYENIYQVVKSSFEKAEHTDGDEQNLVNRLRNSEAFIPDLSLVAESAGKIVGYIMFTKLKVGNTTQLALAPVAVAIDQQKRGIGAKLILEGHKIARNLGYEYSILIGHPNYYPKFGYLPAEKFGISAPFELPDDVFMAINLQGKNTMLNTSVEYPKEFFEK